MISIGIHRTLATLLTVGLLQPMLFAQAAPHEISTSDGVYTAQQAQQGKTLYQAQCLICHGPSLEGMGPNSPLAGPAFLSKWTGRTVAALFQKTIVMMPATGPGTLSPQHTAEIIAYILSVNKVPPGKTDLPSDPLSLEKIQIAAP